MKYIDVFNGDADGICALHQLRLAEPVESHLVTGVKRDIGLLKKVQAQAGDQITVLDISLDKNRNDVLRLLDQGASVRYFDHHMPGEIPSHPNFDPHIDTSAEVCTSLLVNQYLESRFLIWAVVAAFGDNLHGSARKVAVPLELDPDKLEQLRELGECINYNAYGESLEDLYFHPDELFRLLHPFADPFEFIAEAPEYHTLKNGYEDDMAQAGQLKPLQVTEGGRVFILPNAPWSRRVSGVFSNSLATEAPTLAHAVISHKKEGGLLVSVRAPINNKSGADVLCSQFETGGGRKGAAGINHLPEEDLDRFLLLFQQSFNAPAQPQG